MPKLTGEIILGLAEAFLRFLPVEGLELYTMTEGLAAPEVEGRTISNVCLNKTHGRELTEFAYYGGYIDDEEDEERVMPLTARGAAELLGIAANYYSMENPGE